MSDIKFRKAEAGDAAEIAAIEELCFARPWSYQSIYEDLTANPRSLYTVAEVKGHLVGYGGLWHILDEGHITNIAVTPDMRRRHIGQRVVAFLIEEAQREGISRYTLEVRPSNEAAVSMYRKLGFEPAGIRKNYYEDNGEDALIMWRY